MSKDKKLTDKLTICPSCRDFGKELSRMARDKFHGIIKIIKDAIEQSPNGIRRKEVYNVWREMGYDTETLGMFNDEILQDDQIATKKETDGSIWWIWK